jgi:hypothetical protein
MRRQSVPKARHLKPIDALFATEPSPSPEKRAGEIALSRKPRHCAFDQYRGEEYWQTAYCECGRITYALYQPNSEACTPGVDGVLIVRFQKSSQTHQCCNLESQTFHLHSTGHISDRGPNLHITDLQHESQQPCITQTGEELQTRSQANFRKNGQRRKTIRPPRQGAQGKSPRTSNCRRVPRSRRQGRRDWR